MRRKTTRSHRSPEAPAAVTPPDDSRTPRSLRFLAGVLGLLAVLFTAWPAYRAAVRVEIDVNEGWNAYFADAALGNRPLYPAADELITNNYPPLSFYAVGACGRVVGDAAFAGRLLSLAAVFATGMLVGLAVRQFGGSAGGAWVGGVWYVATMGRFFTDYVGMNDPHLLAQAAMLVGFLGFARAVRRDRGYGVAVLAMVAAGFVKHNVVAMPLAAYLWLAVERPRRLPFCVALGVGAAAAGLALCHAVYGPDFAVNILAPRVLDWRASVGAVGHLQWVAVGLVGCVAVVAARPRDPGVRLVAIFLVVALVSFFVQKTGAGVAHSAQFELVVAVAVGVGLAFAHAPSMPLALRSTPDGLRVALLVALVVRLLASARTEPARLWLDASFPAEIAAREAAMADAVARIRATPGDVSAPTLACYWAGKPFAHDPFNARQRVLAGRLPSDAVGRRVESGRLTMVGTDPLLSWTAKYPPGPPSGPGR